MFGYDYNNLNLTDLRKLAGMPVVEGQDDPDSLDYQGPLDGLEGPWTMKNGRVVYYDPKEGKYYDRRQDMYLSDDEARELLEAKDGKVGDTPNIPGPSGGEDELLDEVDEDEEEIAVEEAAAQSEIEAQAGESEVGEDATDVGEPSARGGESEGELDETIEGELNNGYKDHHEVKKDDYFPTGQDQSVSDEAGPASAKQGDNPMQKRTKTQVAEAKEIHKDLVYGYRSFLKEMDNPLRILQDEHRDLTVKLADAKKRNDKMAIASLRSKLAANEDKLAQLETPKF